MARALDRQNDYNIAISASTGFSGLGFAKIFGFQRLLVALAWVYLNTGYLSRKTKNVRPEAPGEYRAASVFALH